MERLSVGLEGQDFQVKAWINRSLAAASSERRQTSEKVKDMVTELQLLIQMAAQRLDRLTTEAVAALPRTLLDLESVQREAEQLSGALDLANQKSSADVDAAFSKLAQMDTVLGRMDATRTCIKEAENWSTLAAEMDAIFISQDYEKAAMRLGEAKRSLSLLTTSSAFEERQALLARLRGDLLKLLGPQLAAALYDRDADATASLRHVYDLLEEKGEFNRQYSNARCEPLLRFWADRASTASADDIQALQHFFERALALLTQEMDPASAPQPDTSAAADREANKSATKQQSDELESLLGYVLRQISPSFSSWLRKACDNRIGRGEPVLPPLVHIYTMSCEFVHAVQSHLHVQNSNKATTSAIPEVGAKQRPASGHWATPLLEAFVPLQSEYAALEARHLRLQTKMLDRLDAEAISALLSECHGNVISNCESALARCEQFTLGVGVFAVQQAINQHLQSFAENLIRALEYLRLQAQSPVVLVSVATNAGMRVEGDAAYDNLSSDDEWADFRAVVAIHNALVMLLGRHEALADMFSAALAARAPVQDESGTPSEAHAATTDIPLAFMLAAAQQGRLRSATPANDSKGPHKTSASDALEKSAFAETALPSSRQALVEAAGSSQALVFDCLFRRVGKHLDTLSSMDCWGLASGGVTSPFDLDLPQFSLSPLAYITRIGELLLALPLHLDTFSGEPSLQFSLETLPNLVSTDAVVASHAGDAGLDTGSQASGDEDERDVTHLWISAVSRAVEAKYVDCILRIPRLTPYGCKQLATDISYLSNVLAAMEIDLEPRLAEVQLRVEQTDAELAGVVEAPAESGSAGAAEAGRDVLAQVAQRIAEQRGLKDAASRGVASSR